MVYRSATLRIDRIVEWTEPVFDPAGFFPGITPEMIATAPPGAIDPATGKLALVVQSYVLRTPRHTILIDTCVGNHKPRPTLPFWNGLEGDRFLAGLHALGLRMEDIDFVMCTHLHVDHVGWNTRLVDGRWVPTFPNARYVFARKELEHWTGLSATQRPPWIGDSVLPVLHAGQVELVECDHALGDHVRLEPTPGHTPHHVAIEAGATVAEAVFCGDLIHSPIQLRHPDLAMRADSDPALAAQTRRRFLRACCDRPVLVCTAHFPLPSCGHVTADADGFAFHPSSG